MSRLLRSVPRITTLGSSVSHWAVLRWSKLNILQQVFWVGRRIRVRVSLFGSVRRTRANFRGETLSVDGPFKKEKEKANAQPRKAVDPSTSDYYMTDAGQRDLLDVLENNSERKRLDIAQSGLSVMDYVNPQCLSIMPVGYDGWTEIELTADSGACDTVVPREGPLSGISIVPFA